MNELCQESSSNISAVTEKTTLTHKLTSDNAKRTIVSKKVASNKKDTNSNIVIIKSKPSSFKMNPDVRRSLTMSIPVSKHETGVVKLHGKTSGQASFRTKSKKKRRSSSFNEQLANVYHTSTLNRKRLPRRSSAGDVEQVRVTHISRHPTAGPLPVDDVRPSIIDSTIKLDDVQQNRKLESSEKTNGGKVHVTTALSHAIRTTSEPRPSQIDTIELTSLKPKISLTADDTHHTAKQSANVVRVEHLKTPKIRSKTSNIFVPSQIAVEEEKNDSNHHENLSKLNVTIGYAPRPKRHDH